MNALENMIASVEQSGSCPYCSNNSIVHSAETLYISIRAACEFHLRVHQRQALAHMFVAAETLVTLFESPVGYDPDDLTKYAAQVVKAYNQHKHLV